MPLYDYNAAVQRFQQARYDAAVRCNNNNNNSDLFSTTTTADMVDSAANEAVESEQQQQQEQVGTKILTMKIKKEYLQLALETIETLSTHCPMTVLLWIQYASTFYEYYMVCCCSSSTATNNIDTNTATSITATINNNDKTNNSIRSFEIAARQLEHQTILLGLIEFPGSALLHVRSICIQIQIVLLKYQSNDFLLQQPSSSSSSTQFQNDNNLISSTSASIAVDLGTLAPLLSRETKRYIQQFYSDITTILQSYVNPAIQQYVGLGSHKNEDRYIVYIYQCAILLRIVQYQLLSVLLQQQQKEHESQESANTSTNDRMESLHNKTNLNDSDRDEDDDSSDEDTDVDDDDDDADRIHLANTTSTTNTLAAPTTPSATPPIIASRVGLQQLRRDIIELYRLRSYCPMMTQNQNIFSDVQEVFYLWNNTHDDEDDDDTTGVLTSLQQDIEQGRMYEARVYQFMNPYENKIEQSMVQLDQIIVPHDLFRMETNPIQTTNTITSTSSIQDKFNFTVQQLQYYTSNNFIDWNVLLQPRSPIRPDQQITYGMGLGSTSTAQLFLQYIQTIKQHLLPKKDTRKQHTRKTNGYNDVDDDDDDDVGNDGLHKEEKMYHLLVSMYERAITECPCIEALWLSYIRELQSWMMIHPTTNPSNNNSKHRNSSSRTIQQQIAYENLQQVSNRAFRNCPYSTSLLQQKLECILLLSNPSFVHNNAVQPKILPKQLLTILQEAIDLGFLPIASSHQVYDIYILPVRIVKRRIMMLLSGMDQAKPTMPTITKLKNKKKQEENTSVLFYDDSEVIPSNANKNLRNIDKKENTVDDNEFDDNSDLDFAYDDMKLEIEALVNEIDDLYKQIVSSIATLLSSRKDQNQYKLITYTEICSWIYQERAQSEMLLLQPLRSVLFLTRDKSSEDSDDEDVYEEEDDVIQNGTFIRSNPAPTKSFQFYETCIRCHNPPHPYSYLMYIHEYSSFIVHPITKKRAAVATITTLYDVLCHIRQIRGLYKKAIESVGKGKQQHDQLYQHQSKSLLKQVDSHEREFESSLVQLCQEWLNFERAVGSPRSHGKASILIEKKLQRFHLSNGTKSSRSNATTTAVATKSSSLDDNPSESARDEWVESSVGMSIATLEMKSSDEQERVAAGTTTDINNTKRKRDTISPNHTSGVDERPHDSEIEQSKKKLKGASHTNTKPTTNEASVTLNESTNKIDSTNTKSKTVRVGNMDYPVHPYTICVSNLAPDTEDMDLVDTFRPLCGSIVHARIVREKYAAGGAGTNSNHISGSVKSKSKGYGYIQFEQQDSVDKALELDDTIGIHEQVVKIDPSHIPAVSLVPSGMHRINPKGEGKVTKRNMKRRQLQTHRNHRHGGNANDGEVVVEDDVRQQEQVHLEQQPQNQDDAIIADSTSVGTVTLPKITTNGVTTNSKNATTPTTIDASRTFFKPRSTVLQNSRHRYQKSHPKSRLQL